MKPVRPLFLVMVLLASLGISAAGAQDAPLPAPLPNFHQPEASDDTSDAPDPSEDAATPDPSSAPADAGAPVTTGDDQDDPNDPPPVLPTSPTKRPVNTISIDGGGSPGNGLSAIEEAADQQPVTLAVRMTDGGNKLANGVTWRIYSTKPDPTGKLQLAAKADTGVAKVSLVPGDYVVHVAYGDAQASDTLTVKQGENSKTMVLDCGALRLNAAVTSNVPIAPQLLKFDVFTSGSGENDRDPVAEGVHANDVVTLNAGTYHIVSYFGDVNAVVRADLRVEPGQLTDATLYHKASQVSFKLVSEAGGEAIADIDWTVKDKSGQTLFTNTGAFPSTVLEQGDYTIFAKRGETVYQRDFQVQPGQPKEIEVLTTVY